MGATRQWLRQHRSSVLVGYDSLAWFAATLGAAVARFDGDLSKVNLPGVIGLSALLCAAYLAFGSVFRLHSGRAVTGSLEEVVLVTGVGVSAGLVGFSLNVVIDPQWVPRAVPIGATVLAVALIAWGRVVWRRWKERDLRFVGPEATHVLVVGAGEGARQLVRAIHRDPHARWRPVGLIDDDPLNRHLRIEGVPVVGGRSMIAEAVQEHGVETIIVAIPSARRELVRAVADTAESLNVDVKVLPQVSEILEANVGIEDVRDLDISDLLGRAQVQTDLKSISDCLTGRRVLVTGAGGSIGSELCRQLRRLGPQTLVMLDHDESALHTTQMDVYGRATMATDDVVLADIRDAEALRSVFETHRPEVVFHAAALKHLPVLERFPGEAVKTNVWGTQNVLEAARAAHVDRFINISTDKAANPISVLGYSKRVAEGLTAACDHNSAGTYVSVRFGNVLGSRGSVATAFMRQIAEGRPLTVTHPDATRYFMTIAEAVGLVIQAAAIGRGAEVLVLDMGEPVNIHSFARRLIALSHATVGVEFIGLRPGEKVHEELLGDGEVDVRPEHPAVSHVPVPPLPFTAVAGLDPGASPPAVIRGMQRLTQRLPVELAEEAG
ncbi:MULTISPECIES: nucleoside-diphosphate sugar epimerase/dehydratase [Mumia]|uniref:nucleoside-diphosphate sugar epimerase/dehydratase n=1 Tax=Mumia TaxID=1546255 RepID=UPI00142469DC|nr:nucleoside-diphosphate sugar epimerase/dehydratase [Mumia sp. ZJ1417]QMW66879.1 polysaccharide biosynthesis protein [Mumia sp. ZJ1417]